VAENLNTEWEKNYEEKVEELSGDDTGKGPGKSGLERFIAAKNALMSTIAVFFLAGFIVSVMIQVTSRTFLPKSPAWTEEIARYFFIYMVAFGASVAVHTKEFVGVDMLTVYFPKIVNKILEVLIYVGLFSLSAFLLKNSVLKFALIKYRMVSTAMQINMKYVYVSMIVLFALLAISYLFEIALVFVRKEEEKKW